VVVLVKVEDQADLAAVVVAHEAVLAAAALAVGAVHVTAPANVAAVTSADHVTNHLRDK